MTTPAIAPVIRAAWVGRRPTEAFAAFTDEIGAWWPLPTHGLFGPEAGGVSFRNGRLIEQATDGREATWGEVRVWEPPNRLVISWHPGGGEDDASEVEVRFEPDGDGTRVELEHRGWEAFGAEATARRRNYVGPNAWGGVLDHFGDGAEPLAVADLTALEAAYTRFFAEAERGDFGPAPDGEWGADEVVAHVALNDAAMIAVCQALVHQQTPRLENVVCQDRDVLAAWVKNSDDRGDMLDRARGSARQLLAALRRLSAEQLATAVECRLLHDGEVVVDDVRPWAAIAVDAQSGVHLPAHTAQLADLRGGD